MGETVGRLALFPLDLVLLPREVVPLHIFEQRYRTMIARCLSEQREFGIVWLSDGGLRRTGCTAEIAEVLERMEDGRMNILVRGVRPFRLLRSVYDLPYPAGDVELLEDSDEEAPPEVGSRAREAYADLVARVTDKRPDPAAVADLDAYAMAASVELPLQAKQELLELRCETERLRKVGELLEAAVRALERAERAGELARSNGRIRP